MGKAEDVMGHQHSAEPVTTTDKSMSKIHKAHRKEVDKMKDPEKRFKASMKYNISHAKEHMKAFKDGQKQLNKMHKG